MTERKMVNETTRIIGLYETLSITDFIFELKELEKDGWESVEIDVEEQYDGNSITLRALKKRPETDDEYNKRVAQEEKMRETRRNAYEILRKEFG